MAQIDRRGKCVRCVRCVLCSVWRDECVRHGIECVRKCVRDSGQIVCRGNIVQFVQFVLYCVWSFGIRPKLVQEFVQEQTTACGLPASPHRCGLGGRGCSSLALSWRSRMGGGVREWTSWTIAAEVFAGGEHSSNSSDSSDSSRRPAKPWIIHRQRRRRPWPAVSGVWRSRGANFRIIKERRTERPRGTVLRQLLLRKVFPIVRVVTGPTLAKNSWLTARDPASPFIFYGCDDVREQESGFASKRRV